MGRFVIDDWYASQSFKIYAEHGHRFDTDNCRKGKERCFGDNIVTKIVRPLEIGELGNEFRNETHGPLPSNIPAKAPLSIVDNIRPCSELLNYLNYLDFLIEKGCYEEGIKDYLKDKIVGVYKDSETASTFKSWLLSSPLLSKLVITDNRIAQELSNEDTQGNYRKYAKSLVDDELIRWRNLSFEPKYVIMGHTHVQDEYELEDGKMYFNLASWLDTVFFKEDYIENRIERQMAVSAEDWIDVNLFKSTDEVNALSYAKQIQEQIDKLKNIESTNAKAELKQEIINNCYENIKLLSEEALGGK
ncbi:MAG: hypothetical protein JEZ07_16215 [Phycisphaerae bacterium]|nr:hypothetical protein [Phycisphaerae bacterium]